MRGALEFAVLQFGPFLPQFFGVLDFEAQFCGFLQHFCLYYLFFIQVLEYYRELMIPVYVPYFQISALDAYMYLIKFGL